MHRQRMYGPVRMMGLSQPIRAVIIGASGGIGAAFVGAIRNTSPNNKVWATSRPCLKLW